jgi:hypothetical protein
MKLTTLLEDSNMVDQILDKILDQGINSLSPFEMEVLDKNLDVETLQEGAMDYLVDRYTDLIPYPDKVVSWGNELNVTHYLDRENNILFSVEQHKEPIAVFSYSRVFTPFSKHFHIDQEEVKLLLMIFLHRAYEISPGKIDFFFDNDDENNQIPGDELSDIKIGPR